MGSVHPNENKERGNSFLGSFLSKGLKTNQLEVNTDERTLRPIPRLKEPRDLFALPKDKEHDCPQQAPRWPIECQVLAERIIHLRNAPTLPEPYNILTGAELKPRPVGEENGLVVFNYNPISAVNYDQHKKGKCRNTEGPESSDSDISSDEDSRCSSAERPNELKRRSRESFSKLLKALDQRSSSNSNDECVEEKLQTRLKGGCDKALTPKTSKQTLKKPKDTAPDKPKFENWTHTCPELNHMARLNVIAPFSRSAVGGAKFLTNCHPYNPDEYDGLQFESRFESGNLAKAVQITQTYYELYLRPDLYTSRSKQWFYFQVKRTRKDLIYRFSIVNLVKADSLYNEGMRPVMYSTISAKQLNMGWRRCGTNICYYRNDEENSTEDEEDNGSYTLTFNIEFANDNDTVYFAHSYPYTYSDLQDYLMDIQKHPVKSKFCKLRLLCRSLAGNNVYYLTVTAPSQDEEAAKRKKAVVVSARVHPSETPASWMMKGLMDFITGDTLVAKRLRHKFIFKLIPMLNPDGVIVGNTRNSLTGKDLNRQYRTVIRETYPSIWYTKAMIKRLIDECGVAMYCDMHAHSRKHNIFIYGCENKRNPEKKLTEQVFPLMMHKNVADKFSFEGCKFKIQRSKEGTGRIVVWMLGITNSYTIEASFGGTTLGSRKSTHFSTADYEHMGRVFCETLLDYCDENPNKERLRLKIIERLLREGSSADEPLNIPLSDYSSDEGETTSSSDNEGKISFNYSDLEGPCCDPLKAPPCSPENNHELRKFKVHRMRKIMRELDRIYFQTLYKRRTRLMLLKQQKLKKHKKKEIIKQNKETSDNSNSNKDEEEDETDLYRKYSKLARLIAGSDQTEASEVAEDSVEQKVRQKKLKIAKKKKKKITLPIMEKTNPINANNSNNLTKPCNGRKKVSRVLRLWLAERQIFIIRQRKTRKLRVRPKSYNLNRKHNRQPLDMPTTDPGSDIIFSTDDEFDPNGNAPNADGNNMPRPRRIHLQSELQRRYIEEIGDGVQRKMPPELIITSPAESTTIRVGEEYFMQMPNTAPGKDRTMEFPMLPTQARRTFSWHNLNNSAKSSQKKAAMTDQSSNYNNEDLQFKLSLKKKIWMGVQQDGGTGMDSNRPLSWSMPPLNIQTKKAKANHSMRKDSTQRKDEKEAFVSACSEKLIAWQQNTSTPLGVPKKKISLNLVNPEDDVDRSYRILKQVNAKPKKQRVPTKLESLAEPKYRRERNTFSKIAETTQLVTRLTKSNVTTSNSTATAIMHSNFHNQSQLRTINVYGQQSKIMVPVSGLHQLSTPIQKNKFKTGGIVATAVQPLARCKSKTKKLKIINTNTSKIICQELTTKVVSPSSVSVETTTFVGKVKAKIKKRRQRKPNSTTDTNVYAVPAAPLSRF